MKPYFKPLFLALVMISSSLAGCIGESNNESVQVTAVFSFSPSTDIRTGDSVELDGSASMPQDG